MWHCGTPEHMCVEPIAIYAYREGREKEEESLWVAFLQDRHNGETWYTEWTGMQWIKTQGRIIVPTREEALELSRVAREKHAARYLLPVETQKP